MYEVFQINKLHSKKINFSWFPSSVLISWVTCRRGLLESSAIVLSWVVCGSEIFCRGFFVGSKFFLLVISWVQKFSREYFVGPKCFSWVFRGSKIFSPLYFVAPVFSLLWLISWFKDFDLLAA